MFYDSFFISGCKTYKWIVQKNKYCSKFKVLYKSCLIFLIY